MTIAATTALCLPPLEIEALLQGRMMVATSHTFRNPPQFVLCPTLEQESSPQLRRRYRPSFLRSIKTAPAEKAFQKTVRNEQDCVTTLYAWAKFDACRIYTQSHDLEALSKLTIWTAEYLQKLVHIQHKIFLMMLQVYRFERPVPMIMKPPTEDKAGCYSRLPYAPTQRSGEAIISAEAFKRRKQQLFDLMPPPHIELEALQAELVQLRESGLGAMSLDRDLRYLLGWSRTDQTLLYDSDLAWIKHISKAGHSDDSHGFNLLVRQSLNKIGFRTSVSIGESQHTEFDLADITPPKDGLGIYCKAPYTLVGHCLAEQSTRTFVTLTQHQFSEICNAYLQPNNPTVAVRILFSADQLTDTATQTAIEHRINIMRPETLQRLAELQAQHPGCIDLYKLKPCLQSAPFGENADDKINQFIEAVLQQLEVRAELIRAVKTCMNNTGEESVGTDAVFFLYAANAAQQSLPELSRQEVQEALVELSSPLSGYLGRVEDRDALEDRRSHRFYFLRELHVEHSILSTVY